MSDMELEASPDVIEALDVYNEPKVLDFDTCSEDQLQAMFSSPYRLLCEKAVSLKKNYILNMASARTESHKSMIAVALSDRTCFLYSLDNNGLNQVTNIEAHNEDITGLVFDRRDSNLLYSSSIDGTLKSWDLRCPDKCANTFREQEGVQVPILSFDVSNSGQFIIAGTEHKDGDAFLLFWDSRSTKLLGGYWESHDDDVTQVKFHQKKHGLVATGSTDGLINVFNIKLKGEYEALQYSLNTEQSVQQLGWFENKNGKDAISCITETNNLQLWDVEEAEKIGEFNREKITKAFQRNYIDDSYLVNTYQNNNKELVILGGSNAGKGECLRTLQIEENELKPLSRLQGNKQIVRCSWFNKEDDIFVTGGEAGILSVWKPGQQDLNNTGNEKTSKSKSKSKPPHKSKPY